MNSKTGLLFLLQSFFVISVVFAQKPQGYQVDITLTNRVDTTNLEVNQVYKLWYNYLCSRPDSLYDNPYWNSAEKKKYKDFDFSRVSVYDIPAPEILDYYKPIVLAIEKEGEKYSIRTLFYAEGLKGYYKRSNPWCSLKVYAIKEGEEWKLENNFPNEVKKWYHKEYKYIRYHYPHTHQFDTLLAQKSIQFCDSIIKQYKFDQLKPFDYYIAKDSDQLGLLQGFEYAFAGGASGKSLVDHRILLAGFDSEFYPHEFVHFITPANKFRNNLIEEGFATWLGGSRGKSFEENAGILAESFLKNDTLSLDMIIGYQWGWQYNAFYTSGAIFCKIVYETKGIKGILELLEEDSSNNEKLYATLKKIMNRSEKELEIIWRNELKTYLK